MLKLLKPAILFLNLLLFLLQTNGTGGSSQGSTIKVFEVVSRITDASLMSYTIENYDQKTALLNQNFLGVAFWIRYAAVNQPLTLTLDAPDGTVMFNYELTWASNTETLTMSSPNLVFTVSLATNENQWVFLLCTGDDDTTNTNVDFKAFKYIPALPIDGTNPTTQTSSAGGSTQKVTDGQLKLTTSNPSTYFLSRFQIFYGTGPFKWSATDYLEYSWGFPNLRLWLKFAEPQILSIKNEGSDSTLVACRGPLSSQNVCNPAYYMPVIVTTEGQNLLFMDGTKLMSWADPNMMEFSSNSADINFPPQGFMVNFQVQFGIVRKNTTDSLNQTLLAILPATAESSGTTLFRFRLAAIADSQYINKIILEFPTGASYDATVHISRMDNVWHSLWLRMQFIQMSATDSNVRFELNIDGTTVITKVFSDNIVYRMISQSTDKYLLGASWNPLIDKYSSFLIGRVRDFKFYQNAGFLNFSSEEIDLCSRMITIPEFMSKSGLNIAGSINCFSCDTGNQLYLSGEEYTCSATPTHVCGDGILQSAYEECDDMSSARNDACSDDCQLNAGYQCDNQEGQTSFCWACPSNCLQCSSTTVCTLCGKGYFLNDGFCHRQGTEVINLQTEGMYVIDSHECDNFLFSYDKFYTQSEPFTVTIRLPSNLVLSDQIISSDIYVRFSNQTIASQATVTAQTDSDNKTVVLIISATQPLTRPDLVFAVRKIKSESYSNQFQDGTLNCTITLSSLYVIPDDENVSINMWNTFGMGIIIASFVISVPLIFTDSFHLLVNFLIALQQCNFIVYINKDLPLNTQALAQSLSLSDFNFLPNIFNYIITSLEMEPYPNNVKTPPKFSNQGKSAFFLDTAGGIPTTLLIFLILVRMLRAIVRSLRLLNNQKRWAKALYWLYEKAEWGATIMYNLLTYLPSSLCLALQLTFIRSSSFFEIISIIFAAIILLVNIGVPVAFIISIRKNMDKVRNSDEWRKRYGSFYHEFRLDSRITASFHSVFMARKLILAILLVLMYEQPQILLVMLILLNLVIMVLILYYQPYTIRYLTWKMVLQEIFSLFLMAMMLSVNDTNSYTTNWNIGWGINIFTCLIVIMNFLVMVIDGARSVWSKRRVLKPKTKIRPRGHRRFALTPGEQTILPTKYTKLSTNTPNANHVDGGKSPVENKSDRHSATLATLQKNLRRNSTTANVGIAQKDDGKKVANNQLLAWDLSRLANK